jgi:hypothetical protein
MISRNELGGTTGLQSTGQYTGDAPQGRGASPVLTVGYSRLDSEVWLRTSGKCFSRLGAATIRKRSVKYIFPMLLA